MFVITHFNFPSPISLKFVRVVVLLIVAVVIMIVVVTCVHSFVFCDNTRLKYLGQVSYAKFLS